VLAAMIENLWKELAGGKSAHEAEAYCHQG
jgi:hypothetical protein